MLSDFYRLATSRVGRSFTLILTGTASCLKIEADRIPSLIERPGLPTCEVVGLMGRHRNPGEGDGGGVGLGRDGLTSKSSFVRRRRAPGLQMRPTDG